MPQRKSRVLTKFANNGKDEVLTANEFVNMIMQSGDSIVEALERHPDDCQCIDCSSKLLIGDTSVDSKRITKVDDDSFDKKSNEKQKEIYIRSRRNDLSTVQDESVIEKVKNIRTKLNGSFFTSFLIYTTGIGIIVSSIIGILRLIIEPDYKVSIAHAVIIIVLGIINERIK